MTHHKQTWAKVNAPVDEGVGELIEALAHFPMLQTIESCEDIGQGTAWVCFQYGLDTDERRWNAVADFVLGFLGPRLMDAVGDIVSLSINVTTVGEAMAEMSVRPGGMSETVKAIHKIAKAGTRK